ncbi:histidine kinase [Chitinophaga sp. S165]|nr:histidine kinase [Chitinophaga sp. S165]
MDSLVAAKLEQVKTLLYKREDQHAALLIDSLQPVIGKLDNVVLHAVWLARKADVLQTQKKSDSARLVILEHIRYAKQYDTTGKLSLDAQSQYGEWLMERDSLQSALRYLEDANYLAKKVDSSQIPKICYSMIHIYMRLWDHSASRKYLEEGLLVSRMPRYYSQAYSAAFTSAYLAFYTRIEQFDSAAMFYELALKDTVSFSQPYYRGVLDWNMGDVLLKKKDYKGALVKLTSGFVNITRYDGPQAILYSTMASINDKLQHYQTALAYADSAIKIAHEQRKWESVTNVWKMKGQIQEKLGNYREAYRAFDSALAAKQVLMDSSIAQTAQEIQTEYQVKAKDDKILTLAELNEANQQIAEQQRTILASLVVTFTLLTVISIMWYRRRRLKTELKEHALRQQLLRTQMEPHFIYNALAVLQGFIHNQQTQKAAAYLGRFSKLLQLSLKNARCPFVSLDSEIAALEEYLFLQVMRSEDSFSYQMELDPVLEEMDVYIPPMLLQPFVENAVLHGFSSLSAAGYLKISVSKRAKLLHCIIEDNGKGINAASIRKHGDKSSFATAITVERLQILSRQSGQKAVLSITDRAEEGRSSGTRVEILIPYRLSPPKDYQKTNQ